MKIQVLGAAGEVTGSAYHVWTKSASVLVDFGMFQGAKSSEKHNRVPKDLNVKRLDAIVVTHGHLDHVGRLPLLTKMGYRNPIYATPATIEITELILHDAAHLQMADTERINRKRKRAGQNLLEPLYTLEDIPRVMRLFRPVEYQSPQEIAPGITVRLVDAGHILGSASVEMTAAEGGNRKVIVFSGDLGPRGAPLLRDPQPFSSADLLIMESTYGDRDHRPLHETMMEGQEILQRAVHHKGKILVPVFAVARAQNILYWIAGMFRNKALPAFPVFLDSPMAIGATQIYAKYTQLFDEEALALAKAGKLREDLDKLQFSQTADDSRALNDEPGPCMILAGAGMCNGGRILHHLKHNLYRPETTVIFVGYQGEGTLGRQLVDGKQYVKIMGEKIIVRAAVHTLGGFSAHAGQTDLLHWFDVIAPSRPRVFLTHGEERSRQPLGKIIKKQYKINVGYPLLGNVIEV